MLEAHAIDPTVYGREDIDAAIKTLDTQAKTRQISYPETLVTSGPVLAELLHDEEFEVVQDA